MQLSYSNMRDRELWVIKRPGMEIPIYVQYCIIDERKCCHIRLGVTLGRMQMEIMENIVKSLGGIRMRIGWSILESVLVTSAEKAMGITPEFYYVWDGERAGRLSEAVGGEVDDSPKTTKKRASEDAAEFLKTVSKTSGIEESSLSMAWLAITQAIPDWMISGRTVDLGSFKLLALPYRDNWDQILLARYPVLKNALMIPSAKRLLQLVFTGASRALRSTELTEYHQTNGTPIHTWVVEVDYDSSWEKSCIAIESKVAKELGQQCYLRRWANRIAQIEVLIYGILARKIKKENAPTCRVQHRRGESGARFLRGSPSMVGYAPIVESDTGGGLSTDDFLGVESVSEHMEKAALSLLEMCSVRPEAQNMREIRRAGSERKPTTDDGLLLRDAICSEAPVEEMLDGSVDNEGPLA